MVGGLEPGHHYANVSRHHSRAQRVLRWWLDDWQLMPTAQTGAHRLLEVADSTIFSLSNTSLALVAVIPVDCTRSISLLIFMQRNITILVTLLGLLLVVAGLYLIIQGPAATMAHVTVARINPGDQEAAWLHPATNIATWERFVAGLKEIPDIIVDDAAAFPEDSMKLPVVGLRKPNASGTLWVRWYKLTGLRTIDVWVNDLCKRQPPPIAIVGGGNSERARDIAYQLHQLNEAGKANLPVFLITTATSDKVQHPELGTTDLMQIYPGRSFRYCYTNRQMAEAICDFVREQIKQDQSLQITSQRISLLSWNDDLYSEDLADQFEEIWRVPSATAPNPPVWKHRIGHSVGGLNQANKEELSAVQKLIREASSESIVVRGRELLVLPGGPAPTRRILRTIYRTDPIERNFWVVAVGDAIDWNTLYRDRRLTWPIEDAPFPLIAFMHRNPVDQKLSRSRSFVPDSSTIDTPNATGTDDLLLYRDIGQSLIQVFDGTTSTKQMQERLLTSLRAELDAQGQPLFDEWGNRPGKGGEFITLLYPLYDGMQVLPKSKVVVYMRQAGNDRWRPIISLNADYLTAEQQSRGQP